MTTTGPTTGLVPSVKGKYAPHRRMANAIIDRTARKGGCEPQDLLTYGFTPRETTELWPMAQAMADVELRLTFQCGKSYAAV